MPAVLLGGVNILGHARAERSEGVHVTLCWYTHQTHNNLTQVHKPDSSIQQTLCHFTFCEIERHLIFYYSFCVDQRRRAEKVYGSLGIIPRHTHHIHMSASNIPAEADLVFILKLT